MLGDAAIRHGFVLPHWAFWGLMIVFPLVFLIIGRIRSRSEARMKADDKITLTEDIEAEAKQTEWTPPGNLFTRVVDAACHNIGVFVSLWTVICVVFYVYEVIGRYFFNSPTNWVHEAAFLMFGVMYTLAGAATYIVDGHVRVDIFYSKWSARGRAGADMVTSVIFYIFILGMLFSGWNFFAQSIDQNALPSWLAWFAQGYNMDLSQTEWQVAYWPIKFAIPFGAFLIAVVGISRFVKDFQTFRHYGQVQDAE